MPFCSHGNTPWSLVFPWIILSPDIKVDDDPQPTPFGLDHELAEVRHVDVARIDGTVVADIVADVPAWGGIKRHKPDTVHAALGKILKVVCQTSEIADAVSV